MTTATTAELVAERVMGRCWHAETEGFIRPGLLGRAGDYGFEAKRCLACGETWDAGRCTPGRSPYSTDVAAAWEVVEAMRARGWWWRVISDNTGIVDATFWREDAGPVYSGTAYEPEGAAAAICRAALAAVEATG